MRYMGDVAPSTPHTFDPRLGFKPLSRDQLVAIMKEAPPFASLGSAADLQFAIDNADVLRDDYAEPLVAFASATNPGKSQRLLHLGLGALAGLVVGAVTAKLVWG